MTETAAAAQSAAAQPAVTPPAVTQTAERQSIQNQSIQKLWWAELWLVALTFITILTTRRLFTSWDYLFIMLLLGVGSHVLMMEMRRQRWPLSLAALSSAALCLLLSTKLLYSYTLFAGFFPTRFTFTEIGTDLSDAWLDFGFAIPPTEATNGFIFGVGFTAWLIAVGSDSLAFRHKSVVFACVPALSLLVFVGILAGESWAALSAAAAVFCALLFAVAHRLAHSKVSWLSGGISIRRQARAPVRLSIGLATVAIIGAIVLTPLLPGVQGGALIALKDLDGVNPPARVALNPLVDARGRLVTTSNTELFRVQADSPAYWRVSGLGTFDGVVWGSDRSYSDASGQLREVRPDEPLLDQVITIAALDSIWLPAAFEPIRFSGDGALYDQETGTLVLESGASLDTGWSYTVTSSLDVPTVEQLSTAAETVPAEIATFYTDLPDDFSPEIISLAQEITAEADTAFLQALALQNFFLDNFTYSLEATSGHDTRRLQRFLFDERSGYCEQFSGSYAAMARAIGLPARVAVGFTPGELIGGEYVVRGEHYHAWPEVWIGDRWVYFEPTPGRGAPRSSSYTGVNVQQAAAGDPNSVLVAEEPSVEITDDPLDGATGDFGGFVEGFGNDGGSSASSDFNWTVVAVVALSVLTVLATGVLIWALIVPALAWLRRRQRRLRALGNHRAEIHCSWQDLCEALQGTGTQRFVGESHQEFAMRAARSNNLDLAATTEVARTMDFACFAQSEPTQDEVETLDGRVQDLRNTLKSQASPWLRAKRTYLRRLTKTA